MLSYEYEWTPSKEARFLNGHVEIHWSKSAGKRWLGACILNTNMLVACECGAVGIYLICHYTGDGETKSWNLFTDCTQQNDDDDEDACVFFSKDIAMSHFKQTIGWHYP